LLLLWSILRTYMTARISLMPGIVCNVSDPIHSRPPYFPNHV
jgi:hypothetical protein